MLTGRMVEHLMFNKHIDAQVIDYFMYKLMKKESGVKYFGFSSLLFKYMRTKGSNWRAMMQNYMDMIENKVQHIFIPFNLSTDKQNPEGFHWSLLALEWNAGVWRHYNSLLLSTQEMCLEDAEEIVKVLKEPINNRRLQLKVDTDEDSLNEQPLINRKTQLKRGEKIDIIGVACHQQEDFPDCAMYVCRFMEDILAVNTMQQTPEVDVEIEMQVLRGDIAMQLIDEQPATWRRERKKPVVAELVEPLQKDYVVVETNLIEGSSEEKSAEKMEEKNAEKMEVRSDEMMEETTAKQQVTEDASEKMEEKSAAEMMEEKSAVIMEEKTAEQHVTSNASGEMEKKSADQKEDEEIPQKEVLQETVEPDEGVDKKEDVDSSQTGEEKEMPEKEESATN